MKALVTGASGFIGANLVKLLINENYNVIAVSRNLPNHKNIKNCKLIEKNFSDIKFEDMEKIDVLFHFAAITDTTLYDQKKMFEANVYTAERLFRDALRNSCNNIVYASSIAVYGNESLPLIETKTTEPLNVYGRSKKELEEIVGCLLKEYDNSKIIGLRYSNVYGPGESHKGKSSSMIYQCAQQMKTGNPKLFEFGEQQRDFLFIDDAVRAALLASKSSFKGVVNCGSGKGTTFNSIVKHLNDAMGMNKKPDYIFNPYIEQYQNNIVLDMTLANKSIPFSSEISIEEGIKLYHKSGRLV
jgi:ADP-L-glycero-D-manno-heptose 6-epimerase